MPFEPRHAPHIARWAGSEEDLHWLAPNTPGPLTPAKVLSWKKDGGEALVLVRRGQAAPLGYGELNPMKNHEAHFWLGHVVVRPDCRGRGIGAALMHLLLRWAFEHRYAERVSLIVFPDNAAAIRCYRRSGFVKTGDEFHQFCSSRMVYRLCRMEVTHAAWQDICFKGQNGGPRAESADFELRA